jgi:hypothetical protein
MADELQTAKLATSIADELSLVPRLHGAYYGALSQLYPLLLAPFFGALSAPAAVHAAHGLNAFLLASAAWPAYLLARRVTGSRVAATLASALAAFTPWLVLSSTLLTENAAYPAFVWAVFLAYRSLAAPSRAADALALVGLALAFFARTQLFVIALALPLALVVHELGYAAALGRRLPDAARTAASRHAVLLGGYAAGAVALGALAAAGHAGAIVGNYAATFEGSLLPPGIWRSAGAHLADVIVAGGVAPFLLSAAWTTGCLARPSSREGHAFAALLAVLVPLLTLEIASFDLRFTPGGFVQDRYLCYLAPLFGVGAAAALAEPGRRLLRAVLVLAAGGAAAALAGAADFSGRTVIYWASPASAFHPALASAARSLGLAPGAFVRWLGVAIAVALACALLRVPVRPLLVAAGAALAGFGAYQAQYVFDRFAVPATTRAGTIPAARRDWIDAVAPGSVALLPSPYLGPEFWWDAEFWNKRVGYALRVGRGPTFTPFPATQLDLDWASGSVSGDEPTDLVVRAESETRLRLAEATTVFSAPPLTLVRVERPYRAEWATRGAELDGWTRPGRSVVLRFYALGRSGPRSVTVVLGAAAEAEAPLRFSLRSRGAAAKGAVFPGRTRRVRLGVRIGRGSGDVLLSVQGSARLPDGRLVGLHLDAVEAGL